MSGYQCVLYFWVEYNIQNHIYCAFLQNLTINSTTIPTRNPVILSIYALVASNYSYFCSTFSNTTHSNSDSRKQAFIFSCFQNTWICTGSFQGAQCANNNKPFPLKSLILWNPEITTDWCCDKLVLISIVNFGNLQYYKTKWWLHVSHTFTLGKEWAITFSKNIFVTSRLALAGLCVLSALSAAVPAVH